MGKITNLPSYNDSSFDMNRNSYKADRLARANDQIVRNDSTNSKVPIHKVDYNPQFSKSPLASQMMHRSNNGQLNQPRPVNDNNRINARDPADIDYHTAKKQNKAVAGPTSKKPASKCNWKKCLMILLGALLLAGLIVGLYFLIRYLIHRNDNGYNDSEIDPSLIEDGTDGVNSNPYYGGGSNLIFDGKGGVQPIDLHPTPYNVYSGGSEYSRLASKQVNNLRSSASESASSAKSTILNTGSGYNTQLNQQNKYPTTYPFGREGNSWNPSQNTINPIDVYGRS